jgi:hypothetical protein
MRPPLGLALSIYPRAVEEARRLTRGRPHASLHRRGLPRARSWAPAPSLRRSSAFAPPSLAELRQPATRRNEELEEHHVRALVGGGSGGVSGLRAGQNRRELELVLRFRRELKLVLRFRPWSSDSELKTACPGHEIRRRGRGRPRASSASSSVGAPAAPTASRAATLETAAAGGEQGRTSSRAPVLGIRRVACRAPLLLYDPAQAVLLLRRQQQADERNQRE